MSSKEPSLPSSAQKSLAPSDIFHSCHQDEDSLVMSAAAADNKLDEGFERECLEQTCIKDIQLFNFLKNTENSSCEKDDVASSQRTSKFPSQPSSAVNSAIKSLSYCLSSSKGKQNELSP